MSRRALTLAALALASGLVAGHVNIAHADCVDTPVTVTFDTGSGIPHCYAEGGMTVCAYLYNPPYGFYDVGLALGDNDGNTSPDLANSTPPNGTVFYTFSMGGAKFAVTSFDFVHFSGSHSFASTKGGFTLTGSEAVTPDPDDWSGITAFQWWVTGSGTPGGVIDNLVLVKQCCGNGVVDTGEQCDDGNTAGNDDDGGCCSATCQFEAGGTPCEPVDGNFCTDDICDGAGTCSHPEFPNCDVTRPCGPIRPPGQPAFEHPKKATMFKSSLIQGFVSCGNFDGNSPDTTTEGGIPACSVETPNERAGSPTSGWQWDESKGQGDIQMRRVCPGASDVAVKLKLKGLVDGSGAPASGQGALRLTVHATLHDPVGGDMQTGPIDGQVGVSLANGSGALTTTVGVILTETGIPDLPNGSSIEILDVQVLDGNGNLFAHPGVFLP